ncbi:MAG: hypothetical protein A2Y24_07230 [Clostridiales bacterium GWE2_32_10]|nr:MAG: hypothetical protein A2Y24_07230 [Clostridiales bacterium GWE2_32_10]HBY20872.1 hypothetical protein [Clostridiales bacterium]
MNKKKWLKVVLLVVILGVAIYGSYAMFLENKTYIKIEDDFDKLGNAYISSMLLKSYEVEQDIKYEIVSMKEQAETDLSYAPSNEDVKKFFEGFKVNAKTTKAIDGKYDIILDVFIDNTSFIKLDLYLDDDMLVLNMPGVYEKKMYIKYEDINKILKKIDPTMTEEINIEDYKKLFDYQNLGKLKEIDGMSYYKLIKSKLKDGFASKGKADIKITENGKEKVYNCDNFELILKQKQMLEVFKELANKLTSDKKVKEFAKGKIDEIYDILIKTNDYKLLGMTQEDIKKQKEDFNKNFDKDYADFVKGFNEELQNSLTDTNQMSTDVNVKYDFAVDEDYNIRKVNAEQTTKDDDITLKMLMAGTIASPNKNIKIVKPDLKDAVNLAELKNEEYQNIATQIGMNLASKSEKSPSIQKFVMPFIMGQ